MVVNINAKLCEREGIKSTEIEIEEVISRESFLRKLKDKGIASLIFSTSPGYSKELKALIDKYREENKDYTFSLSERGEIGFGNYFLKVKRK